MKDLLSRRTILKIGCSAAASPVFTPLVCAAAPGDHRFIAIILRGAMDGLDVVQPYGDPSLQRLRPNLVRSPDEGLLDLDGFFGLNAGLSALYPLWQQGELAFANAVSTPYRDSRSHFDGQDILETGVSSLTGRREGWLNRFLGATEGARESYAVSVGRSPDLILEGPAQYSSWSTQSDVNFSVDVIARFQRMYAKDPLFAAMFNRALESDAITDTVGKKALTEQGVPRLAAEFLKEEARIASFSLGGWDTHIRQSNTIRQPLRRLSDAITTIKGTLGPEIWSRTAIVAMTEFGRTARQNGAMGTDHGTGGLAILSGGAINGGTVHGKWPGLTDSDLYNQRDLMPTDDIRRYPAWMLRSLFGVPRNVLEETIFPGLELGDDLRLIRS